MKRMVLITMACLLSLSVWSVSPDNPAYLLKLSEKKYALKSDGIKMISWVVYRKGGKSVEKQANFLVSKGVLEKEDISDLDKRMTKGFLSKMIMNSLSLSGGVGYSIFGGGRYAYRECHFEGFFGSRRGNSYQYLSGGLLLTVVRRVENRLIKKAK